MYAGGRNHLANGALLCTQARTIQARDELEPVPGSRAADENLYFLVSSQTNALDLTLVKDAARLPVHFDWLACRWSRNQGNGASWPPRHRWQAERPAAFDSQRSHTVPAMARY
jgi:hypothetical protein